MLLFFTVPIDMRKIEMTFVASTVQQIDLRQDIRVINAGSLFLLLS
jgi:hypothetical protein